jgi:hypothetical protein
MAVILARPRRCCSVSACGPGWAGGNVTAPLSAPSWDGYRRGGEVLLWTDSNRCSTSRFVITVQDEQPPYRYVTAQ